MANNTRNVLRKLLLKDLKDLSTSMAFTCILKEKNKPKDCGKTEILNTGYYILKKNVVVGSPQPLLKRLLII